MTIRKPLTHDQLLNAQKLEQTIRDIHPFEFNMAHIWSTADLQDWEDSYAQWIYTPAEITKLTKEGQERDCKSAGCMIGWAQQLKLINTTPGSAAYNQSLAFGQALGLGSDQVLDLCWDGFRATPKEKADQLAEMVRTNMEHGVPLWEVDEDGFLESIPSDPNRTIGDIE
jgi:hypothetical protein